MGTPQYMSPEQAQGLTSEVDERSDIFALGGILYALLTLRPPVEGSTVHEVLEKVRSADITPPTALRMQGGGRAIPAGSEARLPHLADGRVPGGLSAVAMKALLSPRRAWRRRSSPRGQTPPRAFHKGSMTAMLSSERQTIAL